MEPDELEWYIALKDLCTDIATEIYPHYKDLYPAGVKEMTALNPELSEEARAVKIRWFEKVLERLLKLQSRIASSATSNVQPPMSGNVQPPVSHPQHSSSATTHAVPPFFRRHLSQHFLLHGKTGQLGKIDGSATILEFLH